MFWCCCPLRPKKNQNEEELISDKEEETNQSQQISPIIKEVPQKSSDTIQLEKQQKPASPGIKKIANEPNLNKKTNQSEQVKEVKETNSMQKEKNRNISSIQSNDQLESHRKMSSPRGQSKDNVIKYTKSHLWSQPVKSDLIYINLDKQNPIYMSFKLVRNRQTPNPNVLDYYLANSNGNNRSNKNGKTDNLSNFQPIVLIGKESMIFPKMDTLNKYGSKVLNIIFGQGPQRDKHSDMSELLMMGKIKSMRWDGIDQILVLTEGLHTYEQIQIYVNKVLKALSWEELKKISFLFPNFMSIDQIAQLLFSVMGPFALNQSIQKVSSHLSFEIELIEATNLDSAVIVKSKSVEKKTQHAIYDQMKISIAFFGKAFGNKTKVTYREFMRCVKDYPMKDFFDLNEQYSKYPKQFRMKVKDMQKLNLDDYSNLEYGEPMERHQCKMGGFYYQVPKQIREEIGKFCNIADLQKKQVLTPVRQNWEDLATPEDFKGSSKSKLDDITEGELHNINMMDGLLGDDEDDDGLLNCYPKAGEEDYEYELKKEEEARQQNSLGDEDTQYYRNH